MEAFATAGVIIDEERCEVTCMASGEKSREDAESMEDLCSLWGEESEFDDGSFPFESYEDFEGGQYVMDEDGFEYREKNIGKRNKSLGKRGEDAAAKYLDHRGYEILERNWTCFAGEADIIAKDGRTLVFVEVKTRKDSAKGFPSESVTKKKRDKYEKIALAYVANYPEVDIPIRFDVVSIVVAGRGKALIRHHINAFSVM